MNHQREMASLSRYTVLEPEPMPSIWKLVSSAGVHPSENADKPWH